uniref:THAP domain-containing protein 1 n=1 Tax=Sander lucioperca TaxID=283035 RepID=A0A8C9Z022_SANLU
MVDSCCAPGCQNHRGKDKGRALYRIPKDPEKRNKWIAAIKRARSRQNQTERWETTNDRFRLCCDQFISGTITNFLLENIKTYYYISLAFTRFRVILRTFRAVAVFL